MTLRVRFLLAGIAAACIAAQALAGQKHGTQAGTDLGRAIYTNCAACHGAAGQGGFGPPLAGRPSLADKEYAIAKILAGSPHMPPFRQQLTPREIAAVMNWMSRSWAGGKVRVTPAEVTAIAMRMEGRAK